MDCSKCENTQHHKKFPRADKNELYKLVANLITCGFRGSSQEVVDEHIVEYQRTYTKESVKPSVNKGVTRL